ncbi:DUF1830 domain-containing protein [Phormidium sp. CLA17]|uniref:DUF1830 domain-containing protein n=1 Tax=Leptolyngbya sp. Cla-17 TaxID=2803751 RepID=UPI001490C262|nr:DUF1830 domain-containing protein [Leptolyngbya sp. Cla-17]MBM0742510.1 DUF1830 domain-containing protein [Leptolyngbya sp. Cla-17]
MTSVFNPFPTNLSNRILCYYVNTTTQIQKAKILTIPNWLFERVIFPHQRLLFEAIPDALLEIHSCAAAGETLLSKIPCLHLRVFEPSLVVAASSCDDLQVDSVE